jgi:hypothetical protein
MEQLLSLFPHDQVFYAILGVFLPSLIGLASYVKKQKEDLLNKINQSKFHVANALDYVEDCVEGILIGLGPESEGGNTLTEEEKADALEMANKALMELKRAKNIILGE